MEVLLWDMDGALGAGEKYRLTVEEDRVVVHRKYGDGHGTVLEETLSLPRKSLEAFAQALSTIEKVTRE